MNTNGIIRRVDNLGRVVIPREFRKLHKISLGDPMEISCKESGEIVLRKIDMTLTLDEIASSALKLLSAQMGASIVASNTEKFISGSGADKNMFIGTRLPPEIRQALLDRRSFFIAEIPEKWNIVKTSEHKYLACEPIIGESDVFGGLFACGEGAVNQSNITMLKVTASILGSSLQKY